MVRFFHTCFSRHSRSLIAVIPAFTFISGLVLGPLTAAYSGPSALSLMHTATSGSVSIVGLFCVTALPFLLTAFAVYISQYWLLPVISFTDAFLYSYHSSLVFRIHNGSGWLIQSLLLFSGSLSMPVLWYLWLQICHGRGGSARCFAAAFFSIAGIVFMDYYLVSPFLADLLT